MLAEKILSTVPLSIRALRKLSSESLHEDITVQQFRILVMTEEGMGQTQMANTQQISMAAVSKMVDHLVKQGLLKRSPGADRRCLQLSLTAEGKKIHKRVTGHIKKVLDAKFDKLTKEEQSDLQKGLDVLDKLMGMVNEK